MRDGWGVGGLIWRRAWRHTAVDGIGLRVPRHQDFQSAGEFDCRMTPRGVLFISEALEMIPDQFDVLLLYCR